MRLSVKVGALAIIPLFVTMLSRPFTSIGVPKVVDHMHFVLVVFVFSVFFMAGRYKKEFSIFLAPLFVLLVVTSLSALVNKAGILNVVLEFILLVEPILLFMVLVGSGWSWSGVVGYRHSIIIIVVLHAILAYVQYFVMGYRDDDVKGLFLSMGAGHHVAGAVALTAAVYILANRYAVSIWVRFVAFAALSLIVFFTDAKQVVAVFLVSLIVYLLTKITDFKRVAALTVIFVSFSVLLVFLAKTVVPSLTAWASPVLIIEGLKQKLSVFQIFVNHFESGYNWFLGLGPGHTVGRLGWMLPEYEESLARFEVTISEVTGEVWAAQQGHWMSNSITGSSMFSLFFSWAGVSGDLGLAGLLVYLYLWFLVWKVVHNDMVSGFLVITVLIFGGVFSWMEEPGYMLFVVSVLGLRWQELQIFDGRLFGRNLVLVGNQKHAYPGHS